MNLCVFAFTLFRGVLTVIICAEYGSIGTSYSTALSALYNCIQFPVWINDLHHGGSESPEPKLKAAERMFILKVNKETTGSIPRLSQVILGEAREQCPGIRLIIRLWARRIWTTARTGRAINIHKGPISRAEGGKTGSQTKKNLTK